MKFTFDNEMKDALVDALDPLIVALNESDDDMAFIEAAGDFVDVLHHELGERGLTWGLEPGLAALEGMHATDPELSADYPAAVKTIRDYLSWTKGELAKLN